MIQQTGIKRWHPHHNRSLWQSCHDLIRIEPVQKDHWRRVKQRTVTGNKKAMYVKNRQRIEENI